MRGFDLCLPIPLQIPVAPRFDRHRHRSFAATSSEHQCTQITMLPVRRGLGFALEPEKTQMLWRRLFCIAQVSNRTGGNLSKPHIERSFSPSTAPASSRIRGLMTELQTRSYSSTPTSHSRTRALLIANSTLYGGSYMGHCGETIQSFLKKGDVSEVLFVPYALKDYEKYFGE